MTHPAVQRCERCGHLEADHKSSRARGLNGLSFGVCLMFGCGCPEFIPAGAAATAAKGDWR